MHNTMENRRVSLSLSLSLERFLFKTLFNHSRRFLFCLIVARISSSSLYYFLLFRANCYHSCFLVFWSIRSRSSIWRICVVQFLYLFNFFSRFLFLSKALSKTLFDHRFSFFSSSFVSLLPVSFFSLFLILCDAIAVVVVFWFSSRTGRDH